MEQEGIDYAVYPGNHNCYVCSLDVGDVAKRLQPKLSWRHTPSRHEATRLAMESPVSYTHLTLPTILLV